MTVYQQIITIAAVVAGTQLTRWLPFWILKIQKRPSPYVLYMGKILPPAIFGMLVVYCFKDADFLHGTHAVPELVSGCCVAVLQLLFKNMGVSIIGGTGIYMLWVNML